MVPDPNAEHTKHFVHELCPNGLARMIPVVPVEWATEQACIDVVDRLVCETGGQRILGWAVWEWPRVIIEGEFHAVWQRPDGTVVDPTPKKDGETEILFVPDPAAQVTTWQKDNVRKALAHRREILDFIDIKERIHRAKNKGDEAYSPFFTMTPYIEELFRQESEFYRRLVKRFGPPPKPPSAV